MIKAQDNNYEIAKSFAFSKRKENKLDRDREIAIEKLWSNFLNPTTDVHPLRRVQKTNELLERLISETSDYTKGVYAYNDNEGMKLELRGSILFLL